MLHLSVYNGIFTVFCFVCDCTIVCRLHSFSMVRECVNISIVPVAYVRDFWLVWVIVPFLRVAALLGEVRVFETRQVCLWWIGCILSRDVGLFVQPFQGTLLSDFPSYKFTRKVETLSNTYYRHTNNSHNKSATSCSSLQPPTYSLHGAGSFLRS